MRIILKTPNIAAEEPTPIRNRPIIGYIQCSVNIRGSRPITVSKIQALITFLGPWRSSIIPIGRCSKQ